MFDVPADTAQNYHIEGLPFGTRGGMLIKHQFPADGEYTFNVKGVTGYFQAVLGGITGEQLEVTIDGERVKLFDWDKEIASTTGNGKCDAAHSGEGRPAHGRRDVPRHQRRARHRAEPAVPADDEHAGRDPGLPVLSARRPGHDRRAVRREGRERHAEPPQDLHLPPDERRARKTPARARSSRRSRKRAFRRPATAADVDVLMEFYQAGRSEGGTLRRRHRGGAAAHARRSASSSIAASPSRPTLAAGKTYRDQRPGAGVAAVVLPLEQHSRTTS